MNKQEIIKKAQAELPNVDKFENYYISIPIMKPIELKINNEPSPTMMGYYEVRFVKERDRFGCVTWQFFGLSE